MDVPIAKNRDVKPEEYAELRRALTLISGKWKLEILWLLYHRPHRFGELLRTINGVTQHMLTRQLRELEADGLVTRTVFAEVPPRVEYRLSPLGDTLRPILDAIAAWGVQHQTEIAALLSAQDEAAASEIDAAFATA